MQTGVSVERQLTKVANVSVTYLNSRGVHAFYTNFINANQPGALPPSEIFYQYQSGGLFKQNQLIVNSSVRIGAKLSLFGYYTLNYANSDTSGPSYMPSNPLIQCRRLWPRVLRLPQSRLHGRHRRPSAGFPAQPVSDRQFRQPLQHHYRRRPFR